MSSLPEALPASPHQRPVRGPLFLSHYHRGPDQENIHYVPNGAAVYTDGNRLERGEVATTINRYIQEMAPFCLVNTEEGMQEVTADELATAAIRQYLASTQEKNRISATPHLDAAASGFLTHLHPTLQKKQEQLGKKIEHIQKHSSKSKRVYQRFLLLERAYRAENQLPNAAKPYVWAPYEDTKKTKLTPEEMKDRTTLVQRMSTIAQQQVDHAHNQEPLSEEEHQYETDMLRNGLLEWHFSADRKTTEQSLIEQYGRRQTERILSLYGSSQQTLEQAVSSDKKKPNQSREQAFSGREKYLILKNAHNAAQHLPPTLQTEIFHREFSRSVLPKKVLHQLENIKTVFNALVGVGTYAAGIGATANQQFMQGMHEIHEILPHAVQPYMSEATITYLATLAFYLGTYYVMVARNNAYMAEAFGESLNPMADGVNQMCQAAAPEHVTFRKRCTEFVSFGYSAIAEALTAVTANVIPSADKALVNTTASSTGVNVLQAIAAPHIRMFFQALKEE